MKNQRKSIAPFAAAVFAGLAVTASADAAFISGIINGDLGNGAQATGAAVIGSSGDYWNKLSASSGTNTTGVTLSNQLGVSTSVVATWAASGQFSEGGGDGTNDPALMQDYFDVLGGPTNVGTLTLTGLSPNQAYDLYVYSQSWGAARTAAFTANGVSQTVTSPGNETGFVLGSDYAEISTSADNTGTLAITWTTATHTEADFNGFQLTPVPEPASASILALGALLGLRRRRKSRVA